MVLDRLRIAVGRLGGGLTDLHIRPNNGQATLYSRAMPIAKTAADGVLVKTNGRGTPTQDRHVHAAHMAVRDDGYRIVRGEGMFTLYRLDDYQKEGK